MRMKRTYLLLLGLGLLFLVQAEGVAWSQVTERVSVDSTGAEGNLPSTAPSDSSDGRYVAFESSATNLVAGDGNGTADVFVHDRQTGTTIRVSVRSNGTEADDASSDPSISGDGRHVAFGSVASNLVAGDMPFPFGFPDIFVHDRDADGNGTYDEAGGVSTVRVSVDSAGNERLDPSLAPSISADGRYVAFQSDAALVATDSDQYVDIFVHDRDADEDGIYDDEDGSYDPGEVSTVRVSVDSAGTEGNADSGAPSISADGRYVAFESSATNLVPGGSDGSIHIFVHDRDADGDGIYDDEDGSYDPGEVSTVQVSVDSVGTEGDLGSRVPSISADGPYVAFESDATNLVVGDTLGFSDVFVHDRDADGNGTYDEPGAISTTRVSVDLDGVEGNGNSNAPSISADGRSVTFQSDADNLMAGDFNTATDIFVDDLQAGAGGGGGSSSGGGGCFISTAADGSVVTGKK